MDKNFADNANGARVDVVNVYSDLYPAYAAGQLDPGFALMIEAQAQLRSDVGESLAVSEAIAGAALEAEAPTALDQLSVDDVLQRLDAEASAEDVMRNSAASASRQLDEVLALPEAVVDFALDAIAAEGWSQVSSGIQRLKLDVGSQADVELYRLAPSASAPRHSHKGDELTLVLSGGFTDETGSFGPGHVALKTPSDTHQPTADADGPCYTLSVRDGGLLFTGLRGLIQRMISA